MKIPATAEGQRDLLLATLQSFLFDLGQTENIEQPLKHLVEAFTLVGNANGVDTRVVHKASQAAHAIQWDRDTDDCDCDE